MPQISGGLGTELKRLRPETKMLFVSGYPGQTVVDHKVIDVERNFLQKPFTLKQLARKVRAVLDYEDVKASHLAAQTLEHPQPAMAASGLISRP